VNPSPIRGRLAFGAEAPVWRFARFLRATLAHVILAAFRTEITGAEHVPDGGAVIAGNHVSYLDPVLLWCGTKRPAHFMAKKELWAIKPLGWALDHVWAFPVDREGADREAITTATRVLEAGELVGIFPEGTRNRDDAADLGQAQGGVSFIALRAGVPVVPVAIVGTDRAWPRGQRLPRLVKVRIRFCEPVCPEDFTGTRKENVAAMTAEVMRRIGAARAEVKGE